MTENVIPVCAEQCSCMTNTLHLHLHSYSLVYPSMFTDLWQNELHKELPRKEPGGQIEQL